MGRDDFFVGQLKGTLYFLAWILVWAPGCAVTILIIPGEFSKAKSIWIMAVWAPIAVILAALTSKWLFSPRNPTP